MTWHRGVSLEHMRSEIVAAWVKFGNGGLLLMTSQSHTTTRSDAYCIAMSFDGHFKPT